MAKPSDMLNLTEIAQTFGFARGTLNRFLEYPEVRDWLGGAESHPLYPAAMGDRFRYMYEQSERGIKPRPFAISLENYTEVSYVPTADGSGPSTRQDDQPGTLTAMADTSSLILSPAAIGDAGGVFGERFGQVVIELLKSSRVLPSAEDRLLTREEAAKLLACKPTAVGRRVPPVLPETWSHLMIQEYMAGLVAAASAKAAKKRREKADR